MTPDELKNLIKKYQTGNCTDAEKEWIEHWLESLVPNPTNDLSESEEIRIKTTLKGRIQTAIEYETAIRLPVTRISIWRIASIILMLIVAGVAVVWASKSSLFKTSVVYMEIYNPPGRQKVIQLSDKSTVYMNSDTRIRVPNPFSGDTRQVYLEGEAYFEVTKNPAKPFLITIGKLTTRVLGTTFNVKAYKNETHIEVAVLTGKVRVGDSTKAVFLTPGHKAMYTLSNAQLQHIKIPNPNDYNAWINGTLVFEDKTFPEIILMLNRKYNVEIQLENQNLSKCTLNARFKNEPLQTVLEKLCLYMGARYKKTGNKILISGNKCQ